MPSIESSQNDYVSRFKQVQRVRSNFPRSPQPSPIASVTPVFSACPSPATESLAIQPCHCSAQKGRLRQRLLFLLRLQMRCYRRYPWNCGADEGLAKYSTTARAIVSVPSFANLISVRGGSIG